MVQRGERGMVERRDWVERARWIELSVLNQTFRKTAGGGVVSETPIYCLPSVRFGSLCCYGVFLAVLVRAMDPLVPQGDDGGGSW